MSAPNPPDPAPATAPAAPPEPAPATGAAQVPAGEARVPAGEALRFWFKLGFISFGGPAGQIAIMHEELVERRRWISERRFLHALNYCMVLPGPEAQQLATYLGWLMHRTWGGVAAGVLFVLPSLFLLIALSWFYMAWGQTPLVAAVFWGIKPAVTAIVLQAAWRIGRKTLRNPVLWAVAAASFGALAGLGLGFPWIVGGAALIGLVGGRVAPSWFRGSGGHAAAGPDPGPRALIADDTPTPPHARWRAVTFAQVMAAGAALWLLPMGLLCAVWGWSHDYTQMGWFFTKAALMTFGGAYAVLPYVFQGAVGTYGWLSAGQMMDGLALGETTPGPLIMVVTFVGFVGGWNHALLGPEARGLAGVLAATLVTWFTFLPSFLFILAGGPLVESTHRELAFTAPLTAITAAVVGVIVNLALFFGLHVFRPQGAAGGVDGPALALAVAAALALFVARRGVIEVITACAVAGWLIKAL